MKRSVPETVINFCHIQLSLIKERELYLRKQLLDCKIQQEFLVQTIAEVSQKSPESGRHSE